MSMNRYLINGVDVKLRFVKSKNALNIFSLESKIDYKTHMSLFVRKCSLYPNAQLAHERMLAAGSTAKCPRKHVTVRPHAISAGSLTYIADNLFQSKILYRIIIGLLESDDFNGAFNKKNLLTSNTST